MQIDNFALELFKVLCTFLSFSRERNTALFYISLHKPLFILFEEYIMGTLHSSNEMLPICTSNIAHWDG